jgi:pseudouridine-5'-phosphate glycosidase
VKTNYTTEVKKALKDGNPVLALESTIISSGMPYPQNIDFHKKAEQVCYDCGVVPATIAIIKGVVCVGLSGDQAEYIATNKSVEKISKKEIGVCVQKQLSGATTVSSASHIAHLVGIKVFSTGGIGGVHRDYNNSLDMSQDLFSLRETPLIVVCSGVKSFLDINKTVEALETLGVSLVGFQTNWFPSFYSSRSDIKLAHSVNNPVDIVNIYKSNIEHKINSSLLVVNPVPEKHQIPPNKINKIIFDSILRMNEKNIVGKDTTPFLLQEIAKQTKNRSLQTNIVLALNNIELGAKIANEL